MPRHWKPMKDVTNDEMLRGAVSTHRSGDIRMGEPGTVRCHLECE